jgi:hypothetical protein
MPKNWKKRPTNKQSAERAVTLPGSKRFISPATSPGRTDTDGNIVPPLRFHFLIHAAVVAVPLDGTGPSYVGHFHTSDSETIRSVKHGDLFVETDTDHNKVVAKGSDGSRATLQEHHHFTVNANGEVSIEFEKVKASC